MRGAHLAGSEIEAAISFGEKLARRLFTHKLARRLLTSIKRSEFGGADMRLVPALGIVPNLVLRRAPAA